MLANYISESELLDFVESTLKEDFGSGGDLTSNLIVPETARLKANVAARDTLTLAGLDLAAAFFKSLDPDVKIRSHVDDGDNLLAGTILMEIEGNGRALLAAERSALNTLQHLCGIASMTHSYAKIIEDLPCTLLDTRKTIPGLRAIEKYAVMMGGGNNHRMRLDDGILIKDNHIAIVGSIEMAVRAAKAANHGLEVQVEVDTLGQIEVALQAGADRLLLDNMQGQTLRKAVEIVSGRVPLEASGGISLTTIREIASSGVDFVSVGRLTQSAPASDIGLDYSIFN